MAKKVFKCIIIGPPGAGKATISSRIVEHFRILHISCGNDLRRNMKDKTAIGLKAEWYIKAGQLVPDRVIIKFILGELEKISNTSWILDGFPKTVAQAEALAKVKKLSLAINIEVPKEVIIERLQGRLVHVPSGRVYNVKFKAPKLPFKDDITGEPLVKREDDKPDIVFKRLEQYEKTISGPLIKFYKKQRILKTFDGANADKSWPKIVDTIKEIKDRLGIIRK